VFFFWEEILPNFNLKNMISTYAKDFFMKKMVTNSPDFAKNIYIYPNSPDFYSKFQVGSQ
jgi:hypothetical protein